MTVILETFLGCTTYLPISLPPCKTARFLQIHSPSSDPPPPCRVLRLNCMNSWNIRDWFLPRATPVSSTKLSYNSIEETVCMIHDCTLLFYAACSIMVRNKPAPLSVTSKRRKSITVLLTESSRRLTMEFAPTWVEKMPGSRCVHSSDCAATSQSHGDIFSL